MLVAFHSRVTNAIPSVAISAPSAAVRGEPIAYTFTATDPSSIDQAAGFTYAIDWNGDLVTDYTQVGGSSLNLTHTNTTNGNYTVRVAVVDKDGGISSVTTPSTVLTEGSSFTCKGERIFT